MIAKEFKVGDRVVFINAKYLGKTGTIIISENDVEYKINMFGVVGVKIDDMDEGIYVFSKWLIHQKILNIRDWISKKNIKWKSLNITFYNKNKW